MGDRSGGREAKGSSLKKSKNNPGSTVAKAKKQAAETVLIRGQVPQPERGSIFDNSVAILSRLYDKDRDTCMNRAKNSDLSGVLCWFGDVEKQETVAEYCKANPGFCYFACGVHPDNVDRTNKKNHDQWIEKTKTLVCRGECVAVLSGLNTTREMGSHFAQESLLRSSVQISMQFALPLVLFNSSDGVAFDRCLEVLQEEQNEGNLSDQIAVVFHDVLSVTKGNEARIQAAVELGAYFIIIPPPTECADYVSVMKVMSKIPLDRVLVGTGSPWNTPANIEDSHMRSSKNEPSNLSYAIRMVCSVLSSVDSESLDKSYETVLDESEGGCRKINYQKLVDALAENCSSVYGLLFGALNNSAPLAKFTQQVTQIEAPTQSSVMVAPVSAAIREDGGDKSSSEGSSNVTYNCRRCRSILFHEASQKSHDVGGTIFQIGEKGLCSSMLFFEAAVGNDTKLVRITEDGSAECVSCSKKFGQLVEKEVKCVCGATVFGPVVKVNASKIDQCGGSAGLTMDELAAKARQEAEEILILNDIEEQLDLNRKPNEKGKKKSKMKKERGAGNFSSYRNKSFIPNASRVGKNKEGKEEDEEHSDEGSDDES